MKKLSTHKSPKLTSIGLTDIYIFGILAMLILLFAVGWYIRHIYQQVYTLPNPNEIREIKQTSEPETPKPKKRTFGGHRSR